MCRGRKSLRLVLLFAAMSVIFSACSDNKSSPVTNTTAPPSSKPTGTTGIPGIQLVKIAGGFSAPVHITAAGDGSNRLFVVEQQGTIRIIRNGTVLPAPFLDISSRVLSGGERGLLSVVFPPGYGSARNYFYVNYTRNEGGDTVVARYGTTANQDQADGGSEQQLLVVAQPFPNHNGGQLAFGPDRFLYIGMGDGGSADDPNRNGQNPGVLLGKILRIDVETRLDAYTIPGTNPFASRPGYRPEIWALGLRNPWRFSFDRLTGDLYMADVGQDKYEEVNFQPAASTGGENYGWNIMEGRHCFKAATCDRSGLTLPIVEYETHSGGSCSVTGGFVYRGAEFSSLQGVYVYGDFCSGRIWGLRRTGSTVTNRLILESGLAISSFGEDEAGNLYVADLGKGDIYKIVVP
ncbi:MAG: glucose dehydrogenase [Nitrospirae bacterium GWD2_57_9]|nr:MAG: glucose dehydrogenase [Nitrospirae bacterium GWD2_57_9]